ncbi:hypothetical protein FHS96_004995 [Sphingomonas zeicaulis]
MIEEPADEPPADPADEDPLTDDERMLIGLAPLWPPNERNV